MNASLQNIFIAFLLIFSFSACGNSPEPVKIIKAEGPPPAIIPLPDSLSFGENMFKIPTENSICFSSGAEKSAAWLEELLKNANLEPEVSSGDSCGNWNIILDPEMMEKAGEEGYILDISGEAVTLKAATEAGLFYAIQTLRQFFPAEMEQGKLSSEELLLRQAHIEDKPAFKWRGTMVDVARSFFGIEYLKDHIDRMAAYKLNRLHLHLSDDQGWRIEIKSLPKLTEIGGNSSVKNGNSGYLSQKEYLELQEYATARNIIVIPEIDMPGHVYAALRSYPDLNCEGYSNLSPKRATPPEAYQEYRVGWSKLCLEDPKTYEFVTTVIKELVDITSGPWIHIGGDEIKDPRYEEFVVKADSIVRSYGKTAIGWEEVTKGKVDTSMISQKWHGTVKPVVETKIIESLCSSFYLDHANIPGQEHTNNWCKEDGVSLKEVYTFTSDDENMIGVEAAVWTEFVLNEEMLDNRFWPRAIAVAEVGWTQPSKRNFDDFVIRLSRQSERLNKMGIHYFATPEIDWGTAEIAENPNIVFSDFKPE